MYSLFKQIGFSIKGIKHFSSRAGSDQLVAFEQVAKMISLGDFEEIKKAIDEIDLSLKTNWDLLHVVVSATISAAKKDIQPIKYMLDKQVDINTRYSMPFMNPTPLLLAAWRGSPEIVEYLLQFDAKPNLACNLGNDIYHQNVVPLHQAAVWGSEEMTRLLIQFEANINPKTSAGETPLLHACWKGHERVMQLLLEHGADVFAESKKGLTPMDFIRENEVLMASYSQSNFKPRA